MQTLLIAKLRARGIDTERAEDSLRIMQETLRVMQAHKQLIEEMLAQHEAVTSARAAVRASVARFVRGKDGAASHRGKPSGSSALRGFAAANAG